MFFPIKCTKDCGYKEADFMISSYDKLMEYFKENKCPKCKSTMEQDLGEKFKDGMAFTMEGPTRRKFNEKRTHKANNRRQNKSIHENSIKKDPYYDVR